MHAGTLITLTLMRLLLPTAQSTGVEFPEVTSLWEGDKLRCMGAGVRAKKFAFLPVKVGACMPSWAAWHLCMAAAVPLLHAITVMDVFYGHR